MQERQKRIVITVLVTRLHSYFMRINTSAVLKIEDGRHQVERPSPLGYEKPGKPGNQP